MLSLLMGIIYTAVFGWTSHLSLMCISVDALTTAVILFVETVLLWSIFTFSRLEVLPQHLSVSVQIIYILLAAGLLIGAEAIIFYLFFNGFWYRFAPTLATRAFSLAMMYCAFRLYYLYHKQKESDETIPEETMQPSDDMPVETIERITVKVGQKIKIIPVEELLYLKGEDDYISIVTAEGHWLKNERLKDYEASLPSDQFARVHRSYIVNIAKIIKIERYGQKQLLVLSNGESIHISMTGYKVLKEKLKL